MINRSQLFRTLFHVDGFVSLRKADDDVLFDLFADLNPCWPVNMFQDRADGFRAGELEGMLLLPVVVWLANVVWMRMQRRQGKVLVITHAPYGLKSVGSSWRSSFAEALWNLV